MRPFPSYSIPYLGSDLSLHGGLDLGRLRDGVGEVPLQPLRARVRRPLRRLERRREERLLGVHVVRRQRVHQRHRLLQLWKEETGERERGII